MVFNATFYFVSGYRHLTIDAKLHKQRLIKVRNN